MVSRGTLTDAILEPLPVGTRLKRVHDSGFGAVQFNPCMGRSTRFAPLQQDGCIPSLYAGHSLRAALAETVLHEVYPDDPMAAVRKADLLGVSVSEIEVVRPLQMIRLDTFGMGAMGLNMADHFSIGPGIYARCRRLAEDLYRIHSEAEGLMWMSVRDNSQWSYVFHGGRVQPTANPGLIKRSEEPLRTKGSAFEDVLQVLREMRIGVP